MNEDSRLALKEVLAELGVSRTTFWRARASRIEGFPEPQSIGGLLYWRHSQLEAIEAALRRYRGRCAFEQRRRHQTLVHARRARTPAPAARIPACSEAQLGLFDLRD